MAKEYLPGTIGERVRDLRKGAKMTQEELAKSIGVSLSTVEGVQGYTHVTPDMQADAANLLDAYLYGNEKKA